MASIILGDVYALTDQAAEYLKKQGKIVKCKNEHQDVVRGERPVYHPVELRVKAEDVVGWISEAHKKTEDL